MRIAGPGHLAFEPSGLTAVGFEPAGVGLRSLGFVLAVAATAGLLTWVKVRWFPDTSTVVVGVVAALLGIALYRTLMVGRSHRPDQPLTMQFPWATVRSVRDDVRGQGLLVVHVEQANHRGTLHFKPQLSAESVRAAFRRHEIKVK